LWGNDGERERGRDGETERRGDGETERSGRRQWQSEDKGTVGAILVVALNE